MCDVAPNVLADPTATAAQTPHGDGKPPARDPKRIKMWEFQDPIHCSVVGTCASIEDLHRCAKKLRVAFKAGTSDYDIHGHFVQELSRETPFAKLFHKIMDARHTGPIRRVARAQDETALLSLWCEMRDQGAIAGAYWALMTHRHVPGSLRTAVFGEVHMLSHILGASYRKRTLEAADLRTELQGAKEKLRRMDGVHQSALSERDGEIARLQEELRLARMQVAAQPAGREKAREDAAKERQLAKLDRALRSVRGRARLAEARVEALEAAQRASRRPIVAPAALPQTTEDAAIPEGIGASSQSLSGASILYLGGHTKTIERLRSIADDFDCALVHHDGGIEDGAQRLDGLLPSVDCVLCPVNCVSHDASLRAKRACQTMNKPFLPLRSASQTALKNALRELASASRSSH